MRPVQRAQILPIARYEAARAEARAAVMEIKRKRRIHVGSCLTFLFENTATVWYQVQEMLRAEHIEREADIHHELATYNALLGGPGELGCCLLVEIDDPVLRERRLQDWRALPAHVYVRCEGGATVRPTIDPAQIDPRRISAVQYLKFLLDGRSPFSLGCDLPGLLAETTLTREQRGALNDDLLPDADSSNVSPSVGPTPQHVASVQQERDDNHPHRA